MMQRSALALLSLLAATAVAQTPLAKAQEPASPVGKPPPAIKVAKWVKGEPLEKFEKGKVYVVDFWATWCGPCKAAIPHLTKLAEEHRGTVEVIGVSISEKQNGPDDTAYVDAVQKFVDGQGERMNYRVAVDTPDQAMHKAWFEPAGTGGIPTAYIVDQQGNVAWVGIGSPDVVTRIVGEVLAGTFDPKKEVERQQKNDAKAKKRAEVDIAKAREAAKETDEKFPGYQDAMKRGDHVAALEALNAAFRADPKCEASAAYQWKFMLLLQHGKPADVDAYARELLQKFPANDDVLGFASAVLVPTSEDAPRFDAKLARELAEKTLAAAKPDSRWQQFARWRLGWAQWHTGDPEKAAVTMRQALDAVTKLKESIDFDDLDMQCKDALRIFAKGPPKK